ncbi:MAG: histidine kinase, partial [Eggerthellaceae bacterium]|nr:histidine kinase [Eggerthellaceae bacterium]
MLTVQPAPTTDFIGALANTIYQQAKLMGGTIAYSIILQVTENFIHARFSEMVVSIFNSGKTIRFADQGPGFRNKDQALQPGFSSATQPMKRYIKGVGSGLPTVKEWLQV